ncbi:MAG: tRNA (guanosine(37)-N1)-methyltransferase TrmD [Rubrobacteridae bacterium]|nr:tRNA (guanosine(37)-N1)-methyltransferase TrmD [Rubrobacteridae bacterium]
MQIDIITIFPSLFDAFSTESIIRIGREKKLFDIRVHDLRDWTTDKHRQVDDIPYGGGSGMVMKPDPFFKAVVDIGSSNGRVEDVESQLTALENIRSSSRIVLFTPRGKVFNQNIAEELSHEKHIIMLCGRYEGIDERVHEHIATDELSIGDFVLIGGEIPAMAVTEAVVRLIPGVLGADESLAEESFGESLLEYPQYTRPPVFMNWNVPDVLLSGHHGEIAKWRRKERLKTTLSRRQDLLDNAKLTDDDIKISSHLREGAD